MISPFVTVPRSLSEAELEGDRLVRFIYADESGISLKEPAAVVVGVIIHADSQWKAAQTQILSLIEEFVPANQRSGFYFHAKDLYHGTGKIFKTYPRERAIEALKRLVAIPRTLKLPVAVGYVNKKAQEIPIPNVKPRDAIKIYHAFAFSLCAVAAERYMAENTRGEIAQFVAENNTDSSDAIKKMHKYLRGKLPAGRLFDFYGKKTRSYLPLTRIVDCVHFADKDDAILLQVADACAFVLRRHWTQDKSNRYLEDIIYSLCEGGPRALETPTRYFHHAVLHTVARVYAKT